MHLFKQPAFFLAPNVPSIISSFGRFVVASAAIVSLFAASPALAQFGTNLVVNGGAEAGPSSANGDAVSPIPGWTLYSAPSVIKYVNNGPFPKLSSPGPAGRGEQFFAGGWTASSQIFQTIDLYFAAIEIDSKSVTFDCSGWLGGFRAENDNVNVTIYFMDEGWTTIGTFQLGYVNATARQYVTGMKLSQVSGIVPAGTRRVLFTVNFFRKYGSYNDAYADNLYLSLRNAGE